MKTPYAPPPLVIRYIDELTKTQGLTVSISYQNPSYIASCARRGPEHRGTTNFTTFIGNGLTIEEAYWNLLEEIRKHDRG